MAREMNEEVGVCVKLSFLSIMRGVKSIVSSEKGEFSSPSSISKGQVGGVAVRQD